MAMHPNFPVASLWNAMADVPHLYGIAAAKGAMTALRNEIERAEAGLPPLNMGSPAQFAENLRDHLPALCEECPLAA